MKLRERILKLSLRILNDEGIANLKVERLTKDLDISKGNLNYYFPKKDDILIALFKEYNQKMLDFADSLEPETFTVKIYRDALLEMFSIIRKYRGLVFAAATLSSPKDVLKEMNGRFQLRNRLVELFWKALYKNGMIRAVPEQSELKIIIDRLYILSNYWIVMYEFHYKSDMGYKEAERYFAKVYLQELKCHATEKGQKELEEILEE